MNGLHLTEPNPTNNLGKVTVSQQTDADKCGQDDDDNDNDNKGYRNRVLGCRLDSSGTGHS